MIDGPRWLELLFPITLPNSDGSTYIVPTLFPISEHLAYKDRSKSPVCKHDFDMTVNLLLAEGHLVPKTRASCRIQHEAIEVLSELSVNRGWVGYMRIPTNVSSYLRVC